MLPNEKASPEDQAHGNGGNLALASLKPLPLSTPPWKVRSKGEARRRRPRRTFRGAQVGFKPIYNPPCGWARSKKRVLNSEERHIYFSCLGGWRDGMMHGRGEFLFQDKHT